MSEIKDRPKFYILEQEQPDPKELKKFRSKMERIIGHQFYILFSLIGAVFIYQMLAVANADYNSITVALAVLGAGASLNLILDKAITYPEDAIKIN